MVLLKERDINKTHRKKLNKLRIQQHPTIEPVKSILSPITNLSKRILTDSEINILENGLSFVLPDNKFDEMTFISNIETFFVELLGHCTDKKDYEEKEEDEEIKYNLTPIQLQYANKIRSVCNTFRYNADKVINKHKHETIQFKNVLKNLSKDKSILIVKPDKGKGIVIIDKEDYNNKMLEILNDCNTFKIVEVDETILQEDRLIRKLKQLKNDGFITDKEYNFCRPRGSQPARIYGLPKIHKKGSPLRPIVSALGTFNYKLAKLLANKLDYLRKNNTIIKDTFTFVDELLSLKFDNSQIKMISFDITSLFTNVPLNRTIQIILDKLYGPEHTCTYSDMKREDWCNKCKNRYELKYLLETSTKETNFIFNNKIYSQTNGVAMGSPLGPLFADIYVNYIEDKLMSRLKKNGLLYWKRFVDDTFAIIDKDADVDKILDILNSFDNCIVFTFEEETNNSLPFLDINITRLTNNTLTNDTVNTFKNISTNNTNNVLTRTSSSDNKSSNISTNQLNNQSNNSSTKSHKSSNDKSSNISINQLNNQPSINPTNNSSTKPHISSDNKSSNISINQLNNQPSNDLTNNTNIKPHKSSNDKSSNISINQLNNQPSYNPTNNSSIKPHKSSNDKSSNISINQLNNQPNNNLTNNSNTKPLNSSNRNLSHNSSVILNNTTCSNVSNNSKINSFVNLIMKSKEDSSTNSNNQPNNNTPGNQQNVSDSRTINLSTINLNINSTNKSNKKLFANLILNSDKKLIVTSDKNLNNIPTILSNVNSMNSSEVLNINNLKGNKSTSISNTLSSISSIIISKNISSSTLAKKSVLFSDINLNNLNNNNERIVSNTMFDINLTSNVNTNSSTKLMCNNSPIISSNNISNIPFISPTNNVLSTSSNISTHISSINLLNFTNSFSTTIYRKPTYTGLITKWNSFVPKSYKVSTISSMIYRAIRICSSFESMHEEFEFIEFIGKLNGYPVGFIKTQVRMTLGRYYDKTNGTLTHNSKDKKLNQNDNLLIKRRIFVDIPFCGKPTELFKKELVKLSKTIDPLINCQPIQRAPTSSSIFFPLKDPIPKLLTSKVVYKLDCSNCDAAYVGKTVRHVSKRLQEHGDDINKTNVTKPVSTVIIDNSINLRRSDRNKNKVIHYFPKIIEDLDLPEQKFTNSAVKQHENNNNHKIDWINFNIIARDNKNYQLLIKESLLINSLQPALNKTVSSVPLIIFPEGLKTKPQVKIKLALDVMSLVGD